MSGQGRTDARSLEQPRSWAAVPLQHLAAREPRAITDGPFGSNLKTAHYTDAGPRVIRLQNIGHGVFLDAEAHISQEHYELLRNHEARSGDIVVASLGDELPRACLVPHWLGPAIVKADCPRIRVSPHMNAAYLAFALNSQVVRAQAEDIIHGLGRQRLKLADLKRLLIPTAPRAEQDRIVEKIQALFSRVDDGLASVAEVTGRTGIDFSLQRLDSQAVQLKRATLRRAFTGQLVPQDPSDEPIEELLNRLSASIESKGADGADF